MTLILLFQVQFPDISGGNLMYVMSELVDRKDIPWENAIILEGNEIFTLTGIFYVIIIFISSFYIYYEPAGVTGLH